MKLTGEMLIGQSTVLGSEAPIYAINPSKNERLDPAYPGGTVDHVDQACQLAWAAFDQFRTLDLERRAQFLATIADQIEALGDVLIERAMAETGLARARLEGERGRTCHQLRLFATTVRRGEWLDIRIDEALPQRQPLPRFDLRQQHIGLGPVAVFGASNFPLAFSVAGGDTASALAAGCPVVVKAHSAHPGTSELVGKAIQTAVKKCGLAEGVFSMLFGAGNTIGTRLVAHPLIKAVGFTGSRRGGTALMTIAQNRPEPIPVYAEMSSINPVFLLPNMLHKHATQLAQAFVQSLSQSAGQLCTNPGLIIAVKSPALEQFKSEVINIVQQSNSQTMLTPGIYQAYCDNVDLIQHSGYAQLLASSVRATGENQGQVYVFSVDADAFIQHEALQTEMFGAASMIVECQNLQQLQQIIAHLEGQLTAALHMEPADLELAQALLPLLEHKAGRIMVNSWPTGVEVCDAMVHGGPFPSTSDARSTSVGTAAIHRFLRPVCYQNFPDALLPAALQRTATIANISLVNGHYQILTEA